MFLLVCYDIPEDRRRHKICKTLEAFGDHVQESVFQCDLTPKLYQRLRRRLDRLIVPGEDNLRFYFLCQLCMNRVEVIGGRPLERAKSFYIV